MMANESPYLGRKVSLTSRQEIRYEGILYSVDSKQHTVALSKVKSFGTEKRECSRRVYAKSDVYDYIIFRASDIKDFQIIDDPDDTILIDSVENDPAVLQHSDPVPPLVIALMGYPKIPLGQMELKSEVLEPVECAINGSPSGFKTDYISPSDDQGIFSMYNDPQCSQVLLDNSNTAAGLGSQPSHDSTLFNGNIQPPTTDSVAVSEPHVQRIPFQCETPEENHEPAGDETTPASSTPQQKIATKPKKEEFKPIQQGGGSTNGFDFEKANSKFLAFDQYEMEYDKVATGSASQFYDKKKSFFDRISNSQLNPVDWKKEKRNDVETFGQMVSLNKDIYTRQSKGTNYNTRSMSFVQAYSDDEFANEGFPPEETAEVVDGWYC